MKKITDIYREYKIMPILEMHQLRVAAVASQICENLEVPVDEDRIIRSCLLHDMGNIIKFNLDHFPEQNEPEGREYWEGIQNEFKEKYGKNEHIATYKIGEELNQDQKTLDLINCFDSSFAEKIRMSDDFSKKICIYADGRVTPHGVVSFQERMAEAHERYKNHYLKFTDEASVSFQNNMEEIERQIFENCKIKPENIDDTSVKIHLEKLKSFEF